MKRIGKRREDYEKKNEREYRKCIRKEKEREKDRRETEQGYFEATFQHLVVDDPDVADGSDDDQSPYWESDNGDGAEDVRAFDEPIANANQGEYTRLLHNARRRLKRHDAALLVVFDLVVKNGTDREESICELMTMKLEPDTRQTSSTMTTSKKS